MNRIFINICLQVLYKSKFSFYLGICVTYNKLKFYLYKKLRTGRCLQYGRTEGSWLPPATDTLIKDPHMNQLPLKVRNKLRDSNALGTENISHWTGRKSWGILRHKFRPGQYTVQWEGIPNTQLLPAVKSIWATHVHPNSKVLHALAFSLPSSRSRME